MAMLVGVFGFDSRHGRGSSVFRKVFIVSLLLGFVYVVLTGDFPGAAIMGIEEDSMLVMVALQLADLLS